MCFVRCALLNETSLVKKCILEMEASGQISWLRFAVFLPSLTF